LAGAAQPAGDKQRLIQTLGPAKFGDENIMSFENITDTNPDDLDVDRFAIGFESFSSYFFAFAIPY